MRYPAALLALLTLAAASPAQIAAPLQIDVFVFGTAGYHTFRIPAVLVSKKGTLLAFCEGRKHSRSDSGDIDVVLRRSADRGKTWHPPEK